MPEHYLRGLGGDGRKGNRPDERTKGPYKQKSPAPSMYSWPGFIKKDGGERERRK